MLRAPLRVAPWLLLAVLCVPANGRAQVADSPLPLLDVPFISQSESLCGGAAAAMVLRFWGERGINADAFAPLIDRSAGGIRTTVLVGDLRGRGWSVVSLTGTTASLDRELDRGRPPLVLIEDRPRTYHYIVIVGMTPRAVVFHDPARTPFRVMSHDEFDRRWASANRWMALVTPEPSRMRAVGEPVSARSRTTTSCDDLLNRGVKEAQANELDRAEQTLTSALACGGSATLRELAGVRLLQKRWPEVADLASTVVADDPKDDQAWRLLATSRFVQDEKVAALEAWNRVGEPRIDLIKIDGLEKTRQMVVERLLDVSPNAVLTPELLIGTRRRLRDLPSAESTKVDYVPVRSGLAELHATVSERPLFPDDKIGLAMLGTNVVFRRQIDVPIGPLTSQGDRLMVTWRFWPNRPREAIALTAPAPWGGIWGVDAFNERQPFKNELFDVAHRKGGHIGASLWSTHWMRISLRGGMEHWKTHGDFGLAGGEIRAMTDDDRIDARLELTRWMGAGDAASFGTIDFGATVRSTTEHVGRVFIARGGTAAASVSTPPDIWSAGDTGRARGVPLRAHPVIDGGRLDVEQIGRRLHYVSGEAQQWWSYKSKIQLGMAAFVDTVVARQRLFPDSKTDVDVGIGLRASAPGVRGVIRIDIAHGLRDGDDALSFVYEP